jgi:arginase
MPSYHDLVVIPDWLGSMARTGVERGPGVLANALLDATGPTVTGRILSVDIPEPDPDHAKGDFERTKYLPEVAAVCTEARAAVISIYDAGRVPLALVGNDSAMLGVLSGVAAARGPNVGVVWWDAHGDINTPGSSPSGKLYGMPLAHLLGYGDERLLRLNPGKRSLRPENVVLLGSRCLDPGERALIQELGVTCYSSEALMRAASDAGVVEAVSSKLRAQGVTELFVHLDLDVLEPAESPGVSMHEPGGVSVSVARNTLQGLFAADFHLVGLSVSEYNPLNDGDHVTLGIALDVIGDFLRASAGLILGNHDSEPLTPARPTHSDEIAPMPNGPGNLG